MLTKVKDSHDHDADFVHFDSCMSRDGNSAKKSPEQPSDMKNVGSTKLHSDSGRVLGEAGELDFSDEDKKYARNILKDGPAVCFHTGRTWLCREWDVTKFREVANYIIQEYGFQVIELGRADTLKMGISGSIDLRGKVNYSQLAAILSESELFIGIDSFCLHLAMAVGTPVVGLYGATIPELVEAEGSRSYPVHIETSCSGCRHRSPGVFVSCNNPHCMKDISSGMVIDRVNEALNNV